MSTQIQNFYEATCTRNWTATTGDFNVSVLPTISEGIIVISPSSRTLREIVRFTATGTNAYGPFVRVSNIAHRGLGGTTAQSHTIGEKVRMNITAEHWLEMQTDINNIVAAGAANADTITKGIVQQATTQQIKDYTETGSTGAKLFISPDKLKKYLPQTITPLYIHSIQSSGYSDVIDCPTQYTSQVWFNPEDAISPINKNIQLDASPNITGIAGSVTIGDYIYIMTASTGASPYSQKLLRYQKDDFDASPVEITFSGAKTLINISTSVYMTSDGTNFYFSNDAGNSAQSYDFAKFTLSGTTLTYVSTVTCGSLAIGSFAVKADGTIYTREVSASTTIKKYDSTGTLLDTYAGVCSGNSSLINIQDVIYSGVNNSNGCYITKTNL